MSDYKITDKDVQGILNFLKHHHPEQANEEQARAYLEWFKAFLSDKAKKDPAGGDLEDSYKLFLASLG